MSQLKKANSRINTIMSINNSMNKIANIKPELLAPAGSLEGAKAAINAGADAIYAGGKFFSARAYAQNLNNDDMLRAIDYAHIHGRKIYLAVNTLFKDGEIGRLYDFLSPFYKAGLDSVIVQDLGAVAFIKNTFSGLHIHASTQMAVMGIETVKMLERMGADRIIIPRELSLDEIRNIRKNSDIEIESFVHGALCYCYSGQCLLSSFIGGRSGNRGRCAQPCRMAYSAVKDDSYLNSKSEQYILSLKDMCTLNILPEIISAGVISLKIEGRMKKPEYAAGVVSIYRKYIDRYMECGMADYKVSQADFDKLMDLFNRNGFNGGYYKKHNGREMVSLYKPAFRTENEALTADIRDKYINNDIKENINFKLTLSKHLPATIVAECKNITVRHKGAVPDIADNRPLDKQTILKQINKLGSSPFSAQNIELDMDDDIFMSVRELNELRRSAVEKLQKKILAQYKRKDQNKSFSYVKTEESYSADVNTTKSTAINCLVTCIAQLHAAADNAAVESIYVEWSVLSRDNIKTVSDFICGVGKKFFIALPYVCRQNTIQYFDNNKWLFDNDASGYLARNIEEKFYVRNSGCGKAVIFDHTIYSFNNMSKQALYNIGCGHTTVPLELNCRELLARGCEGEEMVVYGYVPVMISAGCVKNTAGRCCNHVSEDVYLKDRMGNQLLCKNNCTLCYNVIYNSKPISLLTKAAEVLNLGLKCIRLEFTNHSFCDTADIINRFAEQYLNGKPQEEFRDFTRGHFTRGVK